MLCPLRKGVAKNWHKFKKSLPASGEGIFNEIAHFFIGLQTKLL